MLEEAVRAWHDAVNSRDLTAARAAVTDPVDVAGPQGAQSISAEAFVDWILRSGIRLRPLSAHPVDENTMVVEQAATWPDNANTDAATTAPTTVATLFRVRDGAVGTVHRFDSLREALDAARS